MQALLNQSSFVLALILSLGSLVFYLTFAMWNRVVLRDAAARKADFNLGIPKGKRETLFALTLVASGTSLSTVFVFFLTASSLFGWWLLLSPLMFGLGNWFTFVVFRRTVAKGYFRTERPGTEGAAGLVPFLGQCFTGSKAVGLFLMLLTVVNLLAVLVLELIVGVEVITYLVQNVFGVQVTPFAAFIVFAISMILLLGYVQFGGFRAVVASDVWQLKAMKWGVLLALASVLIYGWRSTGVSANWGALVKVPPVAILWGFIVNVFLANMFAPVSQEASWQRFRAFATSEGFNLRDALKLSVSRSIFLWVCLMLLAFALQVFVIPAEAAKMTSMSGVLEVIRVLNDWWFPLCVFPIMAVAALTAMYSTADTCVSALLYLGQYSFVFAGKSRQNEASNKRQIPLAITAIFVVSMFAYAFVRLWFDPSILQLIFSVFSNLVVIAPTVITTALWHPSPDGVINKRRTGFVLASLVLGTAAYWVSAMAAIVMGQDFLWLSQLSIALGLFFAGVPVAILWVMERKKCSEGA